MFAEHTQGLGFNSSVPQNKTKTNKKLISYNVAYNSNIPEAEAGASRV
jgi:hypothetical protein